MGDRVWLVAQELFVAAWNEAGSLPELSARLKEAAGGHIPGWALMQRAGDLRKAGFEMKVLVRLAPLHTGTSQ